MALALFNVYPWAYLNDFMNVKPFILGGKEQ